MSEFDPVRLSVMNHLFSAAAEEMGVVLGRSSFSANIKERRDYSCGVFDAEGRLAAQAAHIPVHLGAMPLSTRAVLEDLDLGPDDVAILNDPYRGGTHLPDLTMVAPVHIGGRRRFLVANRAHHADVGGAKPGSMALATSIHEEGFRMPPVHLVREGRRVEETWRLFLANVRAPEEREGDLAAQRAALEVGRRRLVALSARYGADRLEAAAAALMGYTEKLLAAALAELPAGTHSAEDVLDDDGAGSGPIPIRVSIRLRGGRAVVDFTGSAGQVAGGVNANRAVTISATLYAFRCLLPAAAPSNEGLLRPLDIRTRPGSVVDALPPAAVAGGNVETSQRIVDVLFAALARACPGRFPAASAGTMANLSFGGTAAGGRPFSWYETIAGGAGAGPNGPGRSGVQTHMTNTRNTPIEAFEHALPIRITAFTVRRGSGGAGARSGGDGVVREFEALAPIHASLLADRARRGPPGAEGGEAGRPARYRVRRGGRWSDLPSKAGVDLAPGDRIRIETPGGGGHGRPGGGKNSRRTPPRG